jgi:hypothetical protein
MIKHLLISLILCLVFYKVSGQCTGGTANGNITTTATWQTAGTTGINGGTYKVFAALAGYSYQFSFCAADGGTTTYDTQLTIINDATGTAVAGGYNDDFCGLGSNLSWTCTASGNYRILSTLYNCLTQNNMGTLAYKHTAALTCPAGLGLGVTNVSSLPYSSGPGTTCSMANDITVTNATACGSTLYMGGEDAVWIFTPATAGSVTFTLDAPAASYTGFMLYQGCPFNNQGATCITNSSSSTGSKNMVACLQAGVTYYLVLDSWPAPTCNSYNNVTISAPVAPGGCSLGTGQVNVTLPYTATGRTTCGQVDDLTSANTYACGSNFYLSGEDEVFVFTPTTSGSVTLSITSNSTYVGLMLYQGCPYTGGCAGATPTCIGFDQSTGANVGLCANVTAGLTYYAIIDQFAPPSCIGSYNISISAPVSVSTGATCASAVNVTLPYTASNETTYCLGNDYSNATSGSCASLYESGNDKVYLFQATAPTCLIVSLTQASNNAIGFQVYQNCPGAGGVCIGSYGGATSGNLTGTITLPTAGNYYIIVDSWSPPLTVTYEIAITNGGAGAANDLPCNASPLALGVYMNGANNCSGSSSEPAAPACWVAAGNQLHTVWYRFIPTTTQVTIRTTPGTLLNSQMALYSGACNSLTYVACNDNAPSCGTTINNMSQINISTLTPGATYHLVVDGYGSATGTFGIIIVDGGPSNLPPVFGQECAVPNPVCNQVIQVGNPGYQAFGSHCDFTGGGTNCLLSGERGTSWYEIVIQSAGFLEFDIVPNDYPQPFIGDETDYDFALWLMYNGSTSTVVNTCADIAGGAAPTRCNYNYLGVTGLNSNTVNNAPAPYGTNYDFAYERRLPINAGDIIKLVVSNFSNSTSGFTIDFFASPINYSATPGFVVWTGGIDDDWFKIENWGGCAIPTCNIDAIIPPSSANMPAIYRNGAACKSLQINPSSSLTLHTGYTLQVCGNYTNNGLFTAQPNSTVLLNNANVVQQLNGTMVGTSAFNHLTVTKTGGSVVFNQAVDNSGNVTISTAASTINAQGFYHKVAGNFTVAGSYLPGSNTLEFNGTGSQNYSNLGDLNHVRLNATGPGVTLSTNLNLGSAGNLNLINGKIFTTPAYEVYVKNTAPTACNNGCDTSYVCGFLRRNLNGNGAYMFPVGTVLAGHQLALIDFGYPLLPTTIGNLVASFESHPTLPGGIGGFECGVSYSQPALNNGRWRFVANANPLSGNYNTTLYNKNYSNASSGFTVMRNPVSSWNLYNGTCTPSPVTAVQRLNMNGFGTGTSYFGVAQAATPLPVSLLLFEAQAVNQNILVRWVTASESNVSHFELHRSIDGVNFFPITQVQPQGNTQNGHAYSYTDKDVVPGTMYYYKLKTVDVNGQISNSHTIKAITDKNISVIAATPNPFVDFTSITFSLQQTEHVKLEVVNHLGAYILSLENNILKPGQYNYKFDAKKPGLSKGIYCIRLNVGSNVFTTKVVYE